MFSLNIQFHYIQRNLRFEPQSSGMISGPCRYLLENKYEIERASMVNERNSKLPELFLMVY